METTSYSLVILVCLFVVQYMVQFWSGFATTGGPIWCTLGFFNWSGFATTSGIVLNEWDNYLNYTGCATNPEDLKFGATVTPQTPPDS